MKFPLLKRALSNASGSNRAVAFPPGTTRSSPPYSDNVIAILKEAVIVYYQCVATRDPR